MMNRVNRYEHTCLQVRAGRLQGLYNEAAYGSGKYLLCSYLNHTRSVATPKCEEHSEVKVVGEDDETVQERMIHDFRIRGASSPRDDQ